MWYNSSMENKNPIDFVRLLYEFRPNLTDWTVIIIVGMVFFTIPSSKTLSVWKSRLRKRGIFIPDRRKRKENKNDCKTGS